MIFPYILKLGFTFRKANVKIQKFDELFLKINKIIIAGFKL